MLTDTENYESEGPFPSIAEMDMDMWRAAPLSRDCLEHSRHIVMSTGQRLCTVWGRAHADPDRDAFCRRVEIMGDVYEELRKLVDAVDRHSFNADVEDRISTEQARAVLTAFVAPKPFANGTR